MAAVAVVDESESDVIRIESPIQIVLVARHALDIGREEPPDLRADVAATTRGHGVRPDQREARPVVHVLQREGVGLPRLLLVTLTTVRTQLAEVDVLVAPRAALRDELHDGAPVVVAPQAARLLVRASQRHARLGLVVESEALDHLLPVVGNVTQRAVGREVVVGKDRTESGPPAVLLGGDRCG